MLNKCRCNLQVQLNKDKEIGNYKENKPSKTEFYSSGHINVNNFGFTTFGTFIKF